MDLEFVYWVTDSVTYTTLLFSAIYTVYKLRSFGEDFNREANRMTLIMIIFCTAFGIKTSFEWIMFSYKEAQDIDAVGYLLEL